MQNTQQITIREARPEDGKAMMALVRELALYEKSPESVTVSDEHFMESGFGANPVWWALVASVVNEEGEEQVIGFALYYIRYSTWKGQRLYLEDIIVTEAWRGRKVGAQLMDRLIDTAKAKGFSGMMWQVLDWNEPAIRFYRKYKTHFDNEWINVSMEL
ncbi:GNAT family N-acetyltransferase [Taibaiella chishuiensis]|uniref:L-amino acid N-acyltransferase YncA n=1 Tax=Taibaiella chishuiensis TaxID=1434707 RepID=A0A2P8D1I6_9BACT|nr:GNAT family N-acetyltransferase [Taibaiella chishuiensis]PSK91077.1 L-amino acid N-acyltransferase YncA [Taibaiella chishuiensis]